MARKSRGRLVTTFRAGKAGCLREVRAKTVRNARGRGRHAAFFVSKADPKCGIVKKSKKRSGRK